jgi:hypothetical protein
MPARGEWVDLEPLAKPTLPIARRNWSPRVKRLWNAWRQDPVTSQYTTADVAAARELADIFEELLPSEQRLRMDGLGLTPKGKRDLRWRPVQAKAPAPRQAAPALPHLRAV